MIRAFIAIQLPVEIKQDIGRSMSPLKERVDQNTVRWVKASLYHLTLKFLGDIEEHQLPEIERVVGKVAGAGERLSIGVGNFGVFPYPRKPRVLWVGLEETTGALQSLKRSLESALEPEGFKVEKRRFHPHITVGRVRRGVSTQAADQLSAVVENFELGFLSDVKVDTIYLIRSELTPAGPIYSELDRFSLGTQSS